MSSKIVQSRVKMIGMKDLFYRLLKEKFGMDAFRPGQLEAIETLFEKNRLLCIQPTGYGKSLLYQLPSCVLDGVTLVISPLLALMRDQIDQLHHRFHIRAASINSDQTEEENAQARQDALTGKIQILFTSPEQLDHIDRFAFLLNLPINLLVIDEAHCISTWGHDFRPSYRHILQFTTALETKRPKIKILALTATADERVEKDIVHQLSKAEQEVHVFREKMDRPNLHLTVIPASGVPAKLALSQKLLAELPGHGLIYCSTRENAELVAEYLSLQGLSIVPYHAGLESAEKRKIQIGFANNSYRVISATTALGMGIDKKDLRFIIHFDIPGSITAYYQEVGRSGRDGQKAEGILLYDQQDRQVQDYFIESALPKKEDFDAVLNVVKSEKSPPNLSTIKRLTGLHPTRVTTVVAELIDQQFLKKESLKGVQVYFIENQDRSLDLGRYSNQKLVKIEELNKIISYAEQKDDCRMALLRKALGDPEAKNCEHCDICLNKNVIDEQSSTSAADWLFKRQVPIQPVKTHSISLGSSLFDGKLRPPLFVRFMKTRKETEEADPEILSILLEQAATIDQPVGCIIILPSNTWKARTSYGKALSQYLKVPLFDNLLFWSIPPEKRQGELLNNDQRHYNVNGKMQLNKVPNLPHGAILLLDDYIGSGATIKEAARTIRKSYQHPLIPLTIAQIKWKLGKPGFI